VGEAVGSGSDGDDDATTTTGAPAPVDLAVSGVTVPATAAAGVDACGNPISYDGYLLVDGIVDTTWRMDGDGTGQTLTLTLDGPRHVREVGLVPGYAKVDPCDGMDRFTQNRRVTTVTWRFDDGSSATQDLADQATMQTLAVDVTTTTITLRLDAVTSSPERDFTAISEISVQGN
jgi:hypothetical protein